MSEMSYLEKLLDGVEVEWMTPASDASAQRETPPACFTTLSKKSKINPS